MPATFHAGLWSHDFLIELLWRSWSGLWRFEAKSGYPSWSPLYHHKDSSVGSIMPSYIYNIEARHKPAFKPLADVLEIITPPYNPVDNPFGPVRFSRVVLRAWAFEATISSNDWHSQREGVPLLDVHADLAYKIARPEVDMTVTDLNGPNGTGNARSMACSDSAVPFLFVVVGIANFDPRTTGYQGLVLTEAHADYEMVPDDRLPTEGRYWIRVAKWTESSFAKDKDQIKQTTTFIESVI